jgi:hypothetical protein
MTAGTALVFIGLYASVGRDRPRSPGPLGFTPPYEISYRGVKPPQGFRGSWALLAAAGGRFAARSMLRNVAAFNLPARVGQLFGVSL